MRRFVGLRRALVAAGFVEVRCRGTHHRFQHPVFGAVTLCREHGGRELPTGTAAVVRKAIARAEALR